MQVTDILTASFESSRIFFFNRNYSVCWPLFLDNVYRKFLVFLDLSFATILARRIHKLLQERDDRAGTKASDWLRSEALSGTGIQENGTFRKALWQRVYSSVIPILSEVIALVDRDSNLDLVMNEGNWLSNLWLGLFQSNSMVELHYESFLSLESGIIRERVPVATSGREKQAFDLQFPFSWLIKENVDAMWREASSIAGKTSTNILCQR